MENEWLVRLMLVAAAAAASVSACALAEVDTSDAPTEETDGEGSVDDEGFGESPADDIAEPQTVPELIARPDLSAGAVAVSSKGAELVVPEPGHTVTTTTLFDDGTFDELVIETLEDGRVLEHRMPPVVHTASLGPQAPCRDKAFNLFNHRRSRSMGWKLNVRGIPSYYNKDVFEDAIQRGARNITHSRNDCDMPDRVSASQNYLGRTTRKTNLIYNGARCGNRDGHSVVAFQSIPGGRALARACIWSGARGRTLEADIRFDPTHRWFGGKRVPDKCQGRFDVESVATHEFGHAFGIGHVSEGYHSKLTMSEMTRPCDRSARTLGRGDVRALRAKY